MFFETTLTAERIATLTAGGFYTDRLLVLGELPMTPSGKIQKFRLRELAAEDGAGPSSARGC